MPPAVTTSSFLASASIIAFASFWRFICGRIMMNHSTANIRMMGRKLIRPLAAPPALAVWAKALEISTLLLRHKGQSGNRAILSPCLSRQSILGSNCGFVRGDSARPLQTLQTPATVRPVTHRREVRFGCASSSANILKRCLTRSRARGARRTGAGTARSGAPRWPAHLAHQLQAVIEVVDGVQARAEDFAHAVQVVQVGAREVAAGVAAAGSASSGRGSLRCRVADLDVAKAGEQPAVAARCGSASRSRT